MINKRYSKKDNIGLPGGSNQQFTYVTGVFPQDMYHVPKAEEHKGRTPYKPQKIYSPKSGTWDIQHPKSYYSDNYGRLNPEKRLNPKASKYELLYHIDDFLKYTPDDLKRYKKLRAKGRDYENEKDVTKENILFLRKMDAKLDAQENIGDKIKRGRPTSKYMHKTVLDWADKYDAGYNNQYNTAAELTVPFGTGTSMHMLNGLRKLNEQMRGYDVNNLSEQEKQWEKERLESLLKEQSLDIDFRYGGNIPQAQEGWEQPIIYVDSDDDERNQLYQDSFQLYNASLAQKDVFGEGTWLPGGGGTVNKTNVKGALPENSSFSQTEAEYNTRNRLKSKTSKFLKNKELIKKYKNLGFTDDSIKYYNVIPEVFHPSINPTGMYLPTPTTPRSVYQKPHTKVVVRPSINSKTPVAQKKEPSYRVHDFFKHHGMDPSYKSRSEAAKAYGIDNYGGTEEQNKKLIELMLPNYPLDKKLMPRAKQGGNISTEGYKRNSPDVNKPNNIIMGDPSGTPITMGGVDFAVKGVDNLGNEKIMYPEEEHHFPGSMVYETPFRRAQQGIEVPTKDQIANDPELMNWDNYNTQVTKKEQKEFKKWMKEANIHPWDRGAYDIQGYWKEQVKGKGFDSVDDDGHRPDTYKKPNHPTFSMQSKYADHPGVEAGFWDGPDYYAPSTHRNLYGLDYYDWMNSREPDRPEKLAGYMEKPIIVTPKQEGGEFQKLVKKYTTQGWASLNPQEQQFYRETYQKGGDLPSYQIQGEYPPVDYSSFGSIDSPVSGTTRVEKPLLTDAQKNAVGSQDRWNTLTDKEKEKAIEIHHFKQITSKLPRTTGAPITLKDSKRVGKEWEERGKPYTWSLQQKIDKVEADKARLNEVGRRAMLSDEERYREDNDLTLPWAMIESGPGVYGALATNTIAAASKAITGEGKGWDSKSILPSFLHHKLYPNDLNYEGQDYSVSKAISPKLAEAYPNAAMFADIVLPISFGNKARKAYNLVDNTLDFANSAKGGLGAMPGTFTRASKSFTPSGKAGFYPNGMPATHNVFNQNSNNPLLTTKTENPIVTLMENNPNSNLEMVSPEWIKSYEKNRGVLPVEQMDVYDSGIEKAQKAAFDQGKRLSEKWVMSDKAGYDEVNTMIKSLDDKINDIDNNAPQWPTNTEETIRLWGSEDNFIKAMRKYHADTEDLRGSYVENIRELTKKQEDFVDPTFKEKVKFIKDSNPSNTNGWARGHNPEFINYPDDISARTKLIQAGNDPEFYNLPKHEQEYLAKNWDRIGGVRTDARTITLGSKPWEEMYAITPRAKFSIKDPSTWGAAINKPKVEHSKTKIADVRGRNYYDPKRIMGVAAHEYGHDTQKLYGRWVNLLQKSSKKYKYYIPKNDTELAKEIGDAMVSPTMPVRGKRTNETWKSGFGELHSELMAARVKKLAEFQKKYNLSDEAAVKKLKDLEAKGDDELFEWYLKEGDLDKHFKQKDYGDSPLYKRYTSGEINHVEYNKLQQASGTSYATKKKILKYAPAVVSAGYLGSGSIENNTNAGAKQEYQSGGQFNVGNEVDHQTMLKLKKLGYEFE